MYIDIILVPFSDEFRTFSLEENGIFEWKNEKRYVVTRLKDRRASCGGLRPAGIGTGFTKTFPNRNNRK